MVLDEDALEAMLKRQAKANAPAKKPDADASARASKQVELTDKTEEFEVYERPDADSATGTGIRSTRGRSQSPDVFPPAFQDAVPAEPDEETGDEEPASEPEPIPDPDPVVDDEPVAIEEPAPAPARPRVWPPLSTSKSTPPAPVAEREEIIDDEETAESLDLPDPVPQVEPDEPATPPEPVQTSPDSHAHATIRPDGGGVRIAIVQALFNQEITDMMADLAVAKAKKRGAKVTHHLTVPGVYDLPLVTARLLEQDDVDCAVVIGVVVQGETSHDELITHATARTLQQLSLDLDKPIGFGITGPGMTWKQAEARVANGAHAVDAALAQVELIRSL